MFDNAPFVIAIGVCVLSSLFYIKKDETKDGNPKRSSLGTDDMRDGAMSIISFVPIFNWVVCLSFLVILKICFLLERAKIG